MIELWFTAIVPNVNAITIIAGVTLAIAVGSMKIHRKISGKDRNGKEYANVSRVYRDIPRHEDLPTDDRYYHNIVLVNELPEYTDNELVLEKIRNGYGFILFDQLKKALCSKDYVQVSTYYFVLKKDLNGFYKEEWVCNMHFPASIKIDSYWTERFQNALLYNTSVFDSRFIRYTQIDFCEVFKLEEKNRLTYYRVHGKLRTIQMDYEAGDE